MDLTPFCHGGILDMGRCCGSEYICLVCMHMLEAVILIYMLYGAFMHILDAVIFMRVLAGVFIPILDCCHNHAYAR